MSVTPIPADETTPQWQPYIDREQDVKPYLQIPAGANPADQTLQMLTEAACWWAQDYLGQPIAPTTFFRRFSGWTGWMGAYLSLPYSPVLRVVSLIEYWGLNGEHSLVYQTPEAQGGPGEEMFQVDWIHGTLIRSFQGLIQRPFYPGSRNIECTWVAGYDPVPRTFTLGTLELVKYWWSNTQQASRSAAMPAGMQEYDGAIGGNTALWPAVPNRVAEMFQPATQVGIG